MTAGRSRVWAALLVVYVVWGSTYLGVRIALRGFEPFFLSGFRFLVAGLVAGGIGVAIARRNGERIAWVALARSSVIPGLCFFGFGNGAVSWAETRIDSGVTSLVVAGLPLWMALTDRVMHGRKPSALGWAGIAAGIGGVAVLAGPGSGRIDALGVLGLIAGGIAWSIGSMQTRGATDFNPVLAAGAQMLAGAAWLAVFGLANGEASTQGAPSWNAVGGMAYLVFVGTLVGFMTFVWLLRNAPTPLVATYAFVNPVVALLLGWGIEDEPIGGRTIGAAVLIVAAVALIVVAQARAARAEAAQAPATLDP